MSDVQKILTTTEKVNKIIRNVLLSSRTPSPWINVFHVVFVAPMLAYIGYLAVNKPITFGNGIIYLAVGMALYHFYKIVDLFMNEFFAEFAGVVTTPSATTSATTSSSASTTSAIATEVPISATISTSTSTTTTSIATEVPISSSTTSTIATTSTTSAIATEIPISQTSSTTISEDY